MFLSVRLAASATLCALVGSTATAVAASTGVVDALQKKYVITLTTPDREQITQQGGVLDMKVAGVYTLSSDKYLNPDNKVVDGKVQAPSMMMRVTWTKVGGSHVLQTGEKVYLTKIETKSDGQGDWLRLSVLTVDAPSGEAKKFDGIISFKFKKGYLDETPPEEVESAVENVLAPDTGGDANQSDQAGGGAPPPAAAPAPAPRPMPVAAPPPPPAATGATVTIGESSTQVLQAMGMPQQMSDLGKKKIFYYKNANMKIIFIDDKVSDVQ